jgi:hypothetical protein
MVALPDEAVEPPNISDQRFCNPCAATVSPRSFRPMEVEVAKVHQGAALDMNFGSTSDSTERERWNATLLE